MDLDLSTFQAWRSLPAPVPREVSPASVSLPSSAIHDFSKSVKRSISDYQVFKEDHLWHRHLLTTARSHNVDNASTSPTVNATIHGRTTDALRTTDELLMVQ
jgi:hypothetical protein